MEMTETNIPSITTFPIVLRVCAILSIKSGEVLVLLHLARLQEEPPTLQGKTKSAHLTAALGAPGNNRERRSRETSHLPLCGDCLWRPCSLASSLGSLIASVPPGLRRLQPGAVGSSHSPEASTPGPAQLSAGPPRRPSPPDSKACVLALARSSSPVSPRIWLCSAAAAQLPAKLLDLSSGAFPGPSRCLLLLLLQRLHPSRKRHSYVARHRSRVGGCPGSSRRV
ncbi:uncharacterized protein ACBT57_006928 [Dama dama]